MELRATLAVCKSHPRRRVAFSTFDPDAATHTERCRACGPVMFITNCQPGQDDVRRCSVEAGIKTALDADPGTVIQGGRYATITVPTRVRAAGLMLGSYGGPNTDLALVERQVDLGVGYLCTDDVPAVARLMSARATRNAGTAGLQVALGWMMRLRRGVIFPQPRAWVVNWATKQAKREEVI